MAAMCIMRQKVFCTIGLVINELGSLPKTGGGELTITDQLPDGTELYEVPYNISTTSKGKYNPGKSA